MVPVAFTTLIPFTLNLRPENSYKKITMRAKTWQRPLVFAALNAQNAWCASTPMPPVNDSAIRLIVVYFLPHFQSHGLFWKRFGADDDVQACSCSMCTPNRPPLSLSCPPHTLNVICWLLCLISAFGQHFWAEMDAIVTNGTIAKTRKMLFRNSFLRACSRVPGRIWRCCKYAYLCCW